MKLSQIETGTDYASNIPRIGPRVRVLDVGPFIDPRPPSYRSGPFQRPDDKHPLTLADGTVVDTVHRRLADGETSRTYYIAVLAVAADGTPAAWSRIEFVLPRAIDCTWEEHEQRVEEGNRAAAARAAARSEEERQAAAQLRTLDVLANDVGLNVSTPDTPWNERRSAPIRARRPDFGTDLVYEVDPDLLGALLIHAARTGWTPRSTDA